MPLPSALSLPGYASSRGDTARTPRASLEPPMTGVFIRLDKGQAQLDDRQFPGNAIKTSKYEYHTFVPVNLWEQLHRFGNVYFLLISILMYLGEKTTLFIGTIKAFSTLAVLMMMMAVTAFVAFWDDEHRKRADKETNCQTTSVIRAGVIEEIQWQDVQVGNILLIQEDCEFPADLVPLYCATDQGKCYVSTANLDGETNLKLKEAPTSTQAFLSGNGSDQQQVKKQLTKLSIKVEAEAPIESIHTFKGNLQLDSSENGQEKPLGFSEFLLRGTVLKNTEWCIGVVVYTGPDTRMVKNSKQAALKRSSLEIVTNQVMLVVLAAQACLALLSDWQYLTFKGELKTFWYLYPPKLILPDFIGYWLTFLVLYSNMMPISLYPTMEVCNAVQSWFIKNDQDMYYCSEDKEMKFPAGVRSSNLCQEIGQVKYVFSDKTGTLTQNVMELKQLFVDGVVYGDIEKGLSSASLGQRTKELDTMLEILAVAHTVVVSRSKGGKERFEAESPDEGALVKTTANLGWKFCGRDRDGKTGDEIVKVEAPSGEHRTYTILATNEFDSTRKRMSVVIKTDTKYLLFAKGADNVMLERCSKKENDALTAQLTAFSNDGLRTLVFGYRELTAQEFDSWHAKYKTAKIKTDGREAELAAVADEIERDWVIAGCSAIEDKLQDGVPSAIHNIKRAGVKLWVLTGDKLETARNIGYASRVLSKEMEVVIIDREKTELGTFVPKEILRAKAKIDECDQKKMNVGLMVTGSALEDMLSDAGSKDILMNCSQKCSVLICCRVSPLQKAQMVRLVRDRFSDVVTLAIGDGANDVPMIQEAHVGIGIAGREGRQAVNNSDFAIGQFRFLEKLMLVHGRWNYRRVCKVTLFTFWRNAVQVLMIFYYTFISGFSGTSLFEDWIRLSFNFLCSFPIMATGCFDQDVSQEAALTYPQLYVHGREGLDLNKNRISQVLICAVTHSIILLGLTILAFPSMDIHGAGDYYTFGTAVYSCLLIDMNYRVAFLNCTHNRFTVGSVILSLILYGVFLYVYPCHRLFTDILAPNMYMVPKHFAQLPTFWICILAVPALAITVDMFIAYCFQIFDEHNQLIKEVNDHESDGVQGPPDPENVSAIRDQRPVGKDDLQRSGLDLSDLAQQKVSHRHLWKFDCFAAVVSLTFIGTFLILLGYFAFTKSMATSQIRVHYEGPEGYDPWGTRPGEIHSKQDDCGNTSWSHPKTCKLRIKVPQDMNGPILVYYAIGPYYQNFNDYLKSEVTKELKGEIVPESLRETFCISQTRKDANGDDIVPCGMKATSLFNDTFKFAVERQDLRRQRGRRLTPHQLTISRKHLAWDEDVKRYKNPPDYRTRKKTSWLYERFPKIEGLQEDGVNSEHFANWMRPSAQPRVWNPYGYLNDTLRRGETIVLTIKNNYPMHQFSGWKQIVLTTTNYMGGRHNGFGFFLMLSGVGCYCLAIVVMILHICRTRKGEYQRLSPL